MLNNLKNFKLKLILSISLVLVCLATFLLIAIKYSVSGDFGLDTAFINFSQSIRNNFLTGFFKIFTHLGSFITIIVATVILAIIIKPWLAKLFLVANVGFVGVFCLVVKHIVKRPRPIGIALIEETGFSFPSAHSMISIVFYGFLIFLLWKFVKNKKLNIILTALISIMAIMVGYTRVYLGVHYITDVLAGFVAGVAYLITAVWVYVIVENIILRRKNIENQKK